MSMADKRRSRGLRREAGKDGLDKTDVLPAKERILNNKALWFLALLVFAFSLNAIELNWGISGSIPWQPDAIEGEITINHMPLLFKQWRHRYGRGQFLINWAFYQPLINHWSKAQPAVRDASGKAAPPKITQEQAKFLAAISRWITAAMALGTIIAVFVLTKYLLGDYMAAWLAAFSLSTSFLFLFYSGIGHLDVPFTFWFAWACAFAMRAAIGHKWRDYVLAAFCAGYAFCTKEGYGAYLPGLAIAYCAIRIAHRYKETSRIKDAVLSIVTIKALAAIVVFAAVFIAMNGFLNVVQEFSGRMDFWKNDANFQGQTPQLLVLRQSLEGLYGGMGWPLLATLVAGIVCMATRRRVLLVFVLMPILTFYILIVARTHFTQSRFFLPAYVCFAVAIGKAIADWIRFQKVPRWVRYAVVAGLGTVTILYCVGLKLEMKYDTRSRAETWIYEHIDKGSIFGMGMGKCYGPRIKYNGYRVVELWHSDGVRTPGGLVKIMPDYLVMSNVFPCSHLWKDDSAFKKRLYQGQGGYRRVALFESKYIPPARTIFSIAGWPLPRTAQWVSTTMDIFQREEQK